MDFEFRRASLKAALMGAMACAALPAQAQEQAQKEQETMELAPLLVEGARETADGPVKGPFATQSATGTKTDTPIIETPQSISVISNDEMDARDARSVAEAVRYSTGITTENRGGVVTRYDMLSIRGFAINNYYLDGMQLHYNGWYAVPQIAPEMVERLEILKGPASVLYGSSPPGGLINLVSKRPENVASGKISGGIGTNNLYEGMIDATGPLDPEGKFSYRFIGLGRSADGQARTTEVERRLVAPSLKWQPTDQTSLTFLTHYQHDPKGGAFGSVPGAGSVNPNPNGELPTDFYDGDVKFEEFNRKQLSIGYIFEHKFDETFTFTQNARFFRTDIDYQSIYGAALFPDNRTLVRGAIYSDEKSDSFATDNRLSAKFDTGAIEHTLLGGLDYWHLDSDVEIGRLTPTIFTPFVVPPIDIYNPDNDQPLPAVPVTEIYDYKREQTGIYLQEQMKFGGLVVLLGGRQDWYESDDFERLTTTSSSLSQDQFSGRAGILYHFDNGIAPYVSYAESFEPQSGADRFGNVFVPTTGQQIEGGVKFQSPDNTVMLTASVFDLTKQNVTVQDASAGAAAGDQVQQGEIRSRGFEIEGHVRPLSGLTLSAFYTKLDMETTEDTVAANIGKTPVMVADKTASFWAEYALPSGTIDGLTIGGGARYVGETYIDSANTGTTDPYTLYDAMIEYDLGAVSPQLAGNSFRLTGTNLADKRHVTGCFTTLTPTCWFGAERTVTLTFSHRW